MAKIILGSRQLIDKNLYELDEILSIHDKAKKTFSKFTGFKPGREIFGEFKVKKKLPELTNIEGTNFSRFIFDGYLSTKKHLWRFWLEYLNLAGSIFLMDTFMFHVHSNSN